VALPQRVSPPTSVVMTDDLIKAAEAVRIGRRTMRVALESIWIGIGLSIGLMVVAAFGYIPAIIRSRAGDGKFEVRVELPPSGTGPR